MPRHDCLPPHQTGREDFPHPAFTQTLAAQQYTGAGRRAGKLSDKLSMSFDASNITSQSLNKVLDKCNPCFDSMEAMALVPRGVARGYGSPPQAPHPRAHGGSHVADEKTHDDREKSCCQ